MARLPAADWQGDSALAPSVELILQHRDRIGELYPMLLLSPPVAEGMVHFGNGIRKQATLADPIRELVICRVGALTGARYEVYRHEEIARGVGVTDAQLADLSGWRDSDAYTPAQRSALAYAEEMTTSIEVGDALFDPLRDHFDDREVLELTVTVAYYNMISRVLVALEIGVPGSADEPVQEQSS